MLGHYRGGAGEAPPYRVWIALYDDWEPVRDVLSRGPAIPIDIAVVGGGPADRAATLASLKAQWVTPAHICVTAAPGDWQAGDSDWVLMMQAGEMLAPHGLACFAEAARRDPLAGGFYADLDRFEAGGRDAPLAPGRSHIAGCSAVRAAVRADPHA